MFFSEKGSYNNMVLWRLQTDLSFLAKACSGEPFLCFLVSFTVAPLCLVTGTGNGLGLAHQREIRHRFLSPPRHLGS